uniref:acyltransferase family protein n=1 Tax=Faecalibacterium prausnitzii TaxID=853 RepID=UPI0040387F54
MTDKKLISSLQGLRAVAFLCVVLSHCGAPWLGPWAISVFVALSGFLMVCNYYDRPRTAPGLRSAIAFSFKKIRRLYPLHLIMMAAALLFVLKGLLAQPSARGVLSCAAQLAASIFLLQTWIPSSRFWFCLNGVAWYLSVQAFLYAIFPTLLAVLKKADARRLRCIAAAIFCVQCLFSLAVWKAGLSGKAAFYLTYLCPLFRAGDFTISCCAGCLYHSCKS